LSAGASPQTPLGSLQRFPDPLAVFRGPTSKGGERREGREWKGRGRAEEGKGRGEGEEGPEREGEGRGPHDPLAWGPQCLNPALVRSHLEYAKNV